MLFRSVEFWAWAWACFRLSSSQSSASLPAAALVVEEEGSGDGAGTVTEHASARLACGNDNDPPGFSPNSSLTNNRFEKYSQIKFTICYSSGVSFFYVLVIHKNMHKLHFSERNVQLHFSARKVQFVLVAFFF